MQERVKPKTKVTLELDAALVTAARAKGLDLASILELGLERELRRGEPLSADDKAAIEDHNRYIAEHGTLAESLRGL